MILQVVINTLVLGVMYILASLGFAFIFNMLGSINLAHGALYMVGAYVCYYLCAMFGVNNWIAMVIAAVLLAVIGLLLERVMFRPFMADFDRIIMIGVGLMTICQTFCTVITGNQALVIPKYAEGSTTLAGVPVTNERILTFAIGLVLLLVALYIVNRTALGRQMEAVSQDRLGAALQGININRVSAIICAIGCCLAAVAGCFMGAYQGLSANMGDTMNLRILMLVMLAGAGSMNGIIITGAIMGFLDSLFPLLLQGNAGSAVPIAIVVILLLIKPKGFFGHEM
ncbi:MAG: branched-chain amino acid ABC transporter permease [Oscillospiraceae bacterium]|nr:branched-chain amino acid ABC transporter permease [Oscillospiraceae bacterium]